MGSSPLKSGFVRWAEQYPYEPEHEPEYEPEPQPQYAKAFLKKEGQFVPGRLFVKQNGVLIPVRKLKGR